MYYPVLLNIRKRRVVVIGGGTVALRKVKDLLEAGAIIKIVSPEVDDEIMSLKDKSDEQIDIVLREYSSGDLDGAQLAFTTTNDSETNGERDEEVYLTGQSVSGKSRV